MSQLFDVARRTSQNDQVRLLALLELARALTSEPGDYIELGVYQGGSALLLAMALQEAGSTRKLHLCDAWQGMPEPGPLDAGTILRRGIFAGPSEAGVATFLEHHGLRSRVEFHSGWVADTLPGLAGPFALAHVDLDLFEPTRGALAHLLPRMTPQGVVVCDDYGGKRFPGVARAVSEALAACPGWTVRNCIGERDQAAIIVRA